MPTWTAQQLQCLQALNIPVLAFVPSSRPTKSEEPLLKVQQESMASVNPEQLSSESVGLLEMPGSVSSENAKGGTSEVAKDDTSEVAKSVTPEVAKSVTLEVAKGVTSEVAKGVTSELAKDKAPKVTEGEAPTVSAEAHSALDIQETYGLSETTATDETVSAEATTYFYRLGPWFFKSSKQLPVTGIQWVNDLAAYVDTRLSQTSNVGDALEIDAYTQGPLTAEQKRELWNTLKARLNQ